MRTLLLTLGLVLVTYASGAGVRTADAWEPHNMPPHLAAQALAEEPDYADAKLATMRVLSPGGVCSGTAIDHHRVLTAAHCVKVPWGFILGGRTAHITKIELDEYDGVILTTDLYFRHVDSFGPTPKQGDVVFSHGNPAATPDVLLVGRVAGWVSSYTGVPNTMLLDRNDWYGCSGAAVFDRDGRIVGIVNSIFPWPQQGWRLTAVYPLTFTAEQLKRAPKA